MEGCQEEQLLNLLPFGCLLLKIMHPPPDFFSIPLLQLIVSKASFGWSLIRQENDAWGGERSQLAWALICESAALKSMGEKWYTSSVCDVL